MVPPCQIESPVLRDPFNQMAMGVDYPQGGDSGEVGFR